MLYETRFLLALLFSLIIEVPFLFILIKYIFLIKNLKNLDILSVGIIATTLTIPYLWFVIPAFVNAAYYVYIGEGIVIITEAVIYLLLLKIGSIKSLIISIILNMLSYGIGLLIYRFI